MPTALPTSIALYLCLASWCGVMESMMLTALFTVSGRIWGGFGGIVCWSGRLSRGMAILAPGPLLHSIGGKHLFQ
jgi:hypothetical protein